MKALGITAIVWLSVCAFILLIMHIKSHKIIKSILLSAVLAFSAIIIINITQQFTGVNIPINKWTVAGSTVFGLPCVCGIVLLKIIIP